MNKIKVHSGHSIQHKCREQRHPLEEVKFAKEIVDAMVNNKGADDVVFYSNAPDFVSAIKYIAKKHGVEAEFFLDGVSHGDNINPIFADFNKALDLINELGATEN